MKILTALVLLLLLSGPAWADRDFEQAYNTWRTTRDAALRNPDGWLALAGLFWLEPGDNPFGSADENRCKFPGGPSKIGVFRLAPDGRVTVDTLVPVKMGGKSITHAVLDPKAEEGSQKLVLGTLSWYLIVRDGRSAIRLKDSASPVLAAFHGVERYPPDPRWRVTAQFTPAAGKVVRRVRTAQGTMQDEIVLGTLTFTLPGQAPGATPCTLETYGEDDQLFIIFGDATNQTTTYGGGRYLYAARPDAKGQVVLDFNRAYNPPCAFTAFATCSVPTAQNRLSIAIEAGEKKTH